MPGDNQLSGAVNVGIGTNINGRVGKKDLDDVYRFSSTGGSSLDVNLTAIVPRKASKQVIRKTRVGVEIYKLKRSFNEVAGDIGSIDFSNLSASDISANFEQVRSGRARSTRRASFAINPLDAGDYVIRVRQNKLEGRYRLSIGGTLIPDEPIITPDPAPAPTPEPSPIPSPEPTPSPTGGNSLATALPLTLPVTSQSGFVNDSDTEDFYSFSVPSGGDYKFDLFGLTADANVEILDSAGISVKAATTTGSQESLLLPLNEGSYYIRVFQGAGGAASNYGLSAALLTDNAPGTLAGGATTATLLTPTSSLGVINSNYVLDGAKNSIEDLFKINVTERSFLNLELRGLNGSNLTGNLDVELFSADGFNPTSETVILTSSRPGTSAEVFGGTLFTGEYYIRIKPGAAGEGSEYSLSMSLAPKNQVPTITRDINYGKTPIFDSVTNEVIGFTNNSSRAALLTKVGGLAYFVAEDGTDTALWKTDGSLKGTQKLKSFAAAGSISNLVEAGGFLYFVGNDSATGSELWRSDGTTAGTNRVADLNIGAPSSNPTNLVAAGNRLYFNANNTGEIGAEQFYRTNTTGTAIELVPGSVSGINDPFRFSEVKNIFYYKNPTSNTDPLNDTLFFSAVADVGGDTELWTISAAGGANPGAAAESDLNTSATRASSSPNGFVLANNKLYGAATLPNSSSSVVKFSNSGGVYSATAVAGASGVGTPRNFVTVGTSLYFSGTTTANGTELWKIDTTTDTASLLEISPNASSSNPTDLVAVGNSVYFFADNGSGKGLWRHTGTGSATQVAITDSTSGIGTNPSELVAIGNELFFTADNATKGRELWSYNTLDGTMKLNDINAQPDPNNAASTQSSNPARLTNIGGILYFIADTGLDGVELMSL
jgi:ELWxxDGT repeat protein